MGRIMPTETTTTDIFISYSKKDLKRVRPIAQLLEDQGWSVFWDRTIPAGKTWRDAIGDSLATARCVIAIWSNDSISSTWVQEEADHGRSRDILVPILFDDIQPPLGFRSIQARDLTGWDGDNDSPAVHELLNDVSTVLSGGQATTPTTRPPNQRRQGWSIPAVGGGIAIALLLVIAGIWFTPGQIDQPGEDEAEPVVDTEPDDTERFRQLLAAAEDGDVQSMATVGRAYDMGRGVDQDFEEAAKWYRASTEGGDALGTGYLGGMYFSGDGVPQDYAEAMRLYKKAVDMGLVSAMPLIGDMYRDGNGVDPDYEEALRWYRDGADQGSARAMASLGYMYGQGHGVEKDNEEAMQWYRRAAEGGSGWAMYNIGVRYETGNGVPEDYCEAVSWYRNSAARNYSAAADYLQKLGEPLTESESPRSAVSELGGRWTTDEGFIFQFIVRDGRLFGNIQESYGDRSIIGGAGYFDRTIIDGEVSLSGISFSTVERFSQPTYSTNADGDTTTNYVDREVRTQYAGAIDANTIEMMGVADDGRPTSQVRITKACE